MSEIAVNSSRRFFQASWRPIKANWRCGVPRRHFAVATGAGKPANLPLAGIRVLDMTRVLAGVSRLLVLIGKLLIRNQPYCTQILGDLGYAREDPVRTSTEVDADKSYN